MKPKTKRDRLLALLKREWTSPLDAVERCGVWSLAQRVSEWRRQGIDIKDKWCVSPSGSRYKQYKVARG